ncbi:TonB-dependent receptor [Stakelama tenebrarum]|uniref:TonB-dependent receptor n=1 Tax=Stakelama tenebrarum TaxID=2711215 RepID=A0A6G6Y932_9SPHN|nr:TonB-dependent receptor [Sphingosinithalassobacter tenebrarum]QIG81420.1 TonB-dependent receptor [Sphingosinithalassobacter tenebrarum]
MKNTLHTKRKSLRAGTALRALALIGAGAGAVAVAAPAAAQDYTTGTITGTVTDEVGSPISGATVTVTSTGQGFTRTATTGASGTFRFNSLPTGSYDVVVVAEGLPTYTATGVRILSSQTADIDVALITGSTDEIVVSGEAVADFSGTTTGLNVDVAELVKTTPIGRDLTSVVLLAPGTSQGDDGFGNLSSIGGSSVAENAYYLNGLNLTNFDNYLGSTRVPFEFYRSVEVKSGGYPAEFGRATGGIVNAVSKSGSNDFMAAIHLNWAPDFLRSPGKNLTSCDSAGTCINTTNRAFDESDSYSAILEAGGPIIKDRLFVYGLVEFRSTETLTASRTGGLAFDRRNNDPFYAVKVDAYPIDGQHLEFTLFDTRNTTTRRDLAYSELNGVGSTGPVQSLQEFNYGGVNFVGKYTGNFTDWLTVSGAYGRSRDRFDSIGLDSGAQTPYFVNSSGVAVGGTPNGGLLLSQASSSRAFPYQTEREFYRADVDIFVELFGQHHFRGGFDVEENSLSHSTVRTGGDYLFNAGFLSSAAYNANTGSAGAALLLRPSDAIGDIVEVNYFNSGGTFDATNRAFYIQDEWNITDRLTVNLGVRQDDFAVRSPDGSEFISLQDNWAPRLGFTYDLWPDSSGSLYGAYGVYYLPLASNTAFRTAGSEYYIRERYYYSGFDSDGLPILTGEVQNQGAYQDACPFGLTPLSSGNYCNVTGDGSVATVNTFVSGNLEATQETEWIVGYEHNFGGFTAGISYTHRTLDQTAEDVAIDAAVIDYCDDNGIAGCDSIWTGYHQYVLLNPGEDLTIDLLADGTPLANQTVTLTAEQLGYPKAERTYDAVELTFDRKWDGNWNLGGSYTWSKSKGNTEGFVTSDFEQTDAGLTQDFDQPGFTEYAYGYLPNHRMHRFKLWGAVALSDAFTIGTNMSLSSPRKLSCIGYHPTDAFANGYGAASHYCGGQPSPRGTAQESDWIEEVNLSFRYNVEVPTGQVVTLRADVFNLFNSQGIQQRGEFGDLDVTTGPNGLPATYIPNPNYGNPSAYQSPRYVRLGLDVSF